MLEARVGVEPTNGGFADLSLRPLGYRAPVNQYNENLHAAITGIVPGVLITPAPAAPSANPQIKWHAHLHRLVGYAYPAQHPFQSSRSSAPARLSLQQQLKEVLLFR